MNDSSDKRLFWACFVALIATAFGFIVRVNTMDDWAAQFGLDETHKGWLFGVGLWPFALSIVFFSLIIDRIGYGKAMIFAFLCHALSMVITICAPLMLKPDGTPEEVISGKNRGFWMLYAGNFIVALGNGTVEAVINPVVATMFSRNKTQWLNILHAGWPGGLVLGGILALSMGSDTDWRMRVGLLAIPVVLYGLMMSRCKFPVSERVAAGTSYRDMLRQVGFLGALVVSSLIVFEITNVLKNSNQIFVETEPKVLEQLKKEGLEPPVLWHHQEAFSYELPQIGKITIDNELMVKLVIIISISVLFGLYTLSLGRIMFFFLMLIMMPLAITELGVDSWCTDLMKSPMEKLGQEIKLPLKGGYVLVYTSFIMMVLRFFAGPIVHKISPLGLLAVCSAIAACGLLFLSWATGLWILAAATLYGVGKSFFWPTMLGVASERFPKGGALTLNTLGGVGMLAVGIIGDPLLGHLQDRKIDEKLAPLIKAEPRLDVIEKTGKPSVFGEYFPLDKAKVEALSDDDKKIITETQTDAKKSALETVAIFPVIMLVCYLLLIGYFALRGGYKPVVLDTHAGPPDTHAPPGSHAPPPHRFS